MLTVVVICPQFRLSKRISIGWGEEFNPLPIYKILAFKVEFFRLIFVNMVLY